MAQFEKHFVQDLTQDIKIRQCGTIVFNGDNLSNVITVDLYNGAEPYSGGGSVSCSVICPDGATVPITNGSISGSTVTVTLTGDCFALPGQIGVGVQVVSGDIRTTILKAIYNVELLETDTIVDPGSRITASVGQLVSDIENAVAQIPASDMASLMAGIAPTFSAFTNYTAGAYVYYNGTLYRFTANHAAGSWTGTDATQVALSNDLGSKVSDLKSAISELEDANASIGNLAGLAENRNVVVPPNTVKKQILLFDLVANRKVTIMVTRATALNVNTYLYVYDANGNDILGNSKSFPAANTSYSFQFTPQSDYKNAVLLYSVASSATSDVLITSVVATWDSYFAENKSVGYTMTCIAPSTYDGGYPQIDTANTTFTILCGSVIIDRRCENGKYYYILQDTSVDYSDVIDRVVFFWDIENNTLLARPYTNSGNPIPDTYLIIAIYNRISGAVSSAIPIMIDGLLYGITVSSTDDQPVEVEAEYNATRKSNEEVFTADRVSYLFITDLHVDYFPQQTEFSRNQLKIVADMANCSDVDFVVLGGDYIDGTGTKDTATQYLRFITDAIRNCQKPVLVCRGNHDKNNNGSQGSTEYVTTEDFYAIMQAPFRRPEFMYDTEATGTELYYYYDVPGKNTRVIVYDSIFNDRPSEMMKWLCEKALTKKEAGWKYIVVTHVPFNNKYNTAGMTWVGQYGQQMESIISALNNRTTYTGTAGTYTIDVNFTDYLSNIVVISTGHQHTDLVTWDTNTDCFFSTTGCATPSGGQGTFNDPTMQPDGGQTSGRNNMDIVNSNKYLFDLFSVTDASITRSRFGNGVDKTVIKP